jgi:hypothetical protein
MLVQQGSQAIGQVEQLRRGVRGQVARLPNVARQRVDVNQQLGINRLDRWRGWPPLTSYF